MSVLLIVEHNNKEVRPFTLNAITAASQIDPDVHVLLIGNNCEEVAKSLSEMSAVKKVLYAEAAHYENYLAENFAPLVVKVSENYTHQFNCPQIQFCFVISKNLVGIANENKN